jgi:hypothetical protein
MSTRSRIGIREPDGTVTSIYCHSDGYLSYNGKILLEHYQDESKIRELIALGDISVLDKNIGSKVDFQDWKLRELNEQVLAYGRDRNERDCKAENHHTNDWPDTGLYQYLWEDGIWKFRYTGSGRGPIGWAELTKELVTED